MWRGLEEQDLELRLGGGTVFHRRRVQMEVSLYIHFFSLKKETSSFDENEVIKSKA